ALHEHREQSAMRASRLTYAVSFPVDTKPDAALAALGSLTGLSHNFELVAEVVGDEAGIHHVLHIPERVASSVIDQLAAAMPGVRLDPVEPRSSGPVSLSVRFRVPMRALLRTDELEVASRTLLSGFSGLRDEERMSLRWALR